jgi:hypothetical protein
MTTLPPWWEDFRKKYPLRTVRQRTCVYLTDKSTGDNVEIVSENLEVKAEPVKEKTRGNQ